MGKKRFAPIPAKFFEESPLYKKFEAELPESAEWMNRGELYELITMECGNCGGPRAFKLGWHEFDGWLINKRKDALKEEHGEVDCTPHGGLRDVELPPIKPAGDIVVVAFVCARCDGYRYKFMYRVSDDGKSVSKVGQHPPHSIIPPENVKRVLGEHAEDYQRGMANEGSGYGVGAFAYYRRIVENVIAGLLARVEDLIAESGEREKYHQALMNIKGSQSAQNRIDAVKGLLPASLRPGGMNPLDTLFDALSIGLHEETDEYCLDMAAMVRGALVYLISEIDSRVRAAREYEASIAQIKKRVEKRGKTKTDVK